jgi:oxygen-independent coproporphyrinogen-3 oxidase
VLVLRLPHVCDEARRSDRNLCGGPGRDLRSAIIDRPRIENLIADGAVTMIDHRLSISDGAEFLVRSVASAFDAHLAHSAATHSRAV